MSSEQSKSNNGVAVARYVAIKGSKLNNVIKGREYRLESHSWGMALATKHGKAGVTYLLNPNKIIALGLLQKVEQ